MATTVDHISPIWDSWHEFTKGPFQSLCADCHRQKSQYVDVPKLQKAEKLKVETF